MSAVSSAIISAVASASSAVPPTPVMEPLSGLFLTLEGPEGAGKTTQIARLASALAERGIAVTCTREPGGDPVGERVRDLLLHGSPEAEAELLLFAAARAQNVRHVVRPALQAGRVVLCDRFTDSTVAYQGYGRGLPADVIARVNYFATGGLVPDRTFLLNLPPSVGLERKEGEEQNRLDQEGHEFHEKVARGWARLAATYPARIQVIDATQSIEAVGDVLLAATLKLLEARTPAPPAESTAGSHSIVPVSVGSAPDAGDVSRVRV